MSLTGCTEELAGRDHFDLPFTLYGVLSPDLAIQSIRVYPLEDFPSPGSPDPLEVDFTSTDLTTGAVVTWRDSVVVDANGQHEHVFWAPFRAEYGHRYRVEVRRRSDGASSYAEVGIPMRATVRLPDPDTLPLRVRIEGEDLRAIKPEIEYVVSYPGSNDPILAYRFSQQRKEKKVDGGWEIAVNMGYDRVTVQGWFNQDAPARGVDCKTRALRDLRLHVLVGDTVWNPPRGLFDPNVLAHPTVMRNVVNGFGFVGGGYRIDQYLAPSRKAVEDACFYYAW